jgi:serine/threonine protein kinase
MPKIPETIGNFKILQSLGRGGTSQVYKALHPTLKKEVVLKKLTLKGSGPARERFQREAEIMMAFNHSHIVQVYDIFKEGSSWIIVQEYVDGPNLEEVINDKGGLGKAGSLRIVHQCLKALVYIHKKGVVHRDIKPSNIFLSSRGRVKLGDFGIASRLEGGQGLTREGAALGTPDFMAPEQALNPSSVDGRADLYSLSLSWYEAWTGEPYPRKGRLAGGVGFTLAGHLMKKGARKNRLFRFSSALSMLFQIRFFLFPLLFWGKKGQTHPGSIKKFPHKRLAALALLPLLIWGLSTAYFGILKDDQYGRFSLSLPYEADTASWYVSGTKARIYRYEEGGLTRDRTLLLFNRRNRNTLQSRPLYLRGGSYSLRLSLPDREEWYGFFMDTDKKDILWDTLDHPLLPVTVSAFLSDLLTGNPSTRGNLAAHVRR